MAISWMTALKIIPWGNVLESAPHIVKAAKHLFSATKADEDNYASASDSGRREGLAGLDSRIRLMEERIAELRQEQQSQTADTTPLNTNAPGEGRLCKDGENGNSRKRACKGNHDADTTE